MTARIGKSNFDDWWPSLLEGAWSSYRLREFDRIFYSSPGGWIVAVVWLDTVVNP